MRSPFTRGFLALLPLWPGAIPAGIAYGLSAREAGLGVVETQLMSLIVFSAAGQFGALSLLAAGAPLVVLVGTAVALNAQLLLLSLAVGRQCQTSWEQRLVAAWFLTDGAYGIATGLGQLRLPALVGAGMSMYLAWNLGTGLGAAVSLALPDPRRLGIDLVVPLCFLAVLMPLIRARTALLVVLVSGVTTLLLSAVAPIGVAVLGAGVLASATGAWWSRRERAEAASLEVVR